MRRPTEPSAVPGSRSPEPPSLQDEAPPQETLAAERSHAAAATRSPSARPGPISSWLASARTLLNGPHDPDTEAVVRVTPLALLCIAAGYVALASRPVAAELTLPYIAHTAIALVLLALPAIFLAHAWRHAPPRDRAISDNGSGRPADNAEIRRHERLKDEFIATVSHELRTPLSSINGSIALLSAGALGPLPDRAMPMMRIAQRNGERLAALISDVLDMERIESGAMRFDTGPLDVNALVERAFETNRGVMESFGINLRFEAMTDAPIVLADPDRMHQVMANLLSNAAKFSSRGQDVIVTTAADDTNVSIAVRDFGPGVPDDYKERIFDKFVQVDATDTRDKGGTGLGLSIVRQIVIRLGGDIEVRDAAGGGSQFLLTLPRWHQTPGGDEDIGHNEVHDPLTGLLNRHYLHHAVEREVHRAERRGARFAILKLAVSGVRPSAAKAMLLERVADYIKDHIRGEDIPCRYADDAFVIVLLDIDRETAMQRARVFTAGLKRLHVAYDGGRLESISPSLGVSVFPDHGQDCANLLAAAERALAEARSAHDRIAVAPDPAPAA